MKKLFSLILIALLIGGWAVSDVSAASHNHPNAEIFGEFGGPAGVSPASRIVRVRYAAGAQSSEANMADLASGDIVVWNITSADGVTVSLATASTNPFAGVMVSPCLKAVTGDYTVDGSDRNWGYMCVSGFCHAKIDVSDATDGYPLRLNEVNLNSFATAVAGVNSYASQDIGVLLKEPAADGNGHVWLRR